MFYLSPTHRAAFGLPLLALVVGSQIGLAQPPQAPSTIKKPADAPVRLLPVADPPLISPAELQTLTGGPTLVTFSGRDVPITDAIETLREAGQLAASNTRFAIKKSTLNIEWQQTPFWKAAAEIEDQTQMKWDTRFDNGFSLTSLPIIVSSGLDGSPAAQTPFVTLVANTISRSASRTVSLALKPAPNVESAAAHLQLSAYFDPKLTVQSKIVRAVKFLRQGETAPLAGQDHTYDFDRDGGPIFQISLDIPAAIAPGTTLSSISGVLHSVVVSASQPFQIPDLAATPNAAQRVGQNIYELQNTIIEGDRITIRVAATLPDAPELARRLDGNGSFLAVRVRDAQGHALQRSASTLSDDAKATASFTFNLKNAKGDLAPGPYSLDWPLTTETRSFDVPFELRDVVVP